MNNAFGWGPLLGEVPAIPYAPFSRTDRLGKIADFTEPTDDQPRVRSRPREAFGYNSASAFSYAAPDDTSFSVVDRVSVQRKSVTQKRLRGKGFPVQRRNDPNRKTGFYNRKRMEKPRLRDTSIKVGTSWTIVDEVEFSRLSKLSYDVDEPRDVAFTGTLQYYEKTFDRVTTRNEKNLPQLEAVMTHFPTTSEDSVIQEIAKESQGPTVFTTDKVLGALMCANRSTYSWELIVKKEQDRIYLDKREGGSLDFLTVNENAAEPPVESADKESINGPSALAMEATMINQAFVKTAIKSDETLTFPNENYMEDSAFRYREWDLGTTANEEPIRLVVRTHIDAAIHVPNASPSCELNSVVSSTHKKGETLLATIHALNEFDSKAPGAGGAPEWRQKLDSQRGAVMATEMKNNNNKLARWTVESVLSGADQMKLGMVSRAHSKDRHHHIVLGMLTLKPEDFAKQLNLSLENGWGIVKTFVDLFYRKLQDGTYVLMKDPNKPLMRLYAVPDSQPVEELQEDFEEEETQPIMLVDE